MEQQCTIEKLVLELGELRAAVAGSAALASDGTIDRRVHASDLEAELAELQVCVRGGRGCWV